MHDEQQSVQSLMGCVHLWTADIISAIEFDGDGQHLATGDRGGRVVLFERVATQQQVLALLGLIESYKC